MHYEEWQDPDFEDDNHPVLVFSIPKEELQNLTQTRLSVILLSHAIEDKNLWGFIKVLNMDKRHFFKWRKWVYEKIRGWTLVDRLGDAIRENKQSVFKRAQVNFGYDPKSMFFGVEKN